MSGTLVKFTSNILECDTLKWIDDGKKVFMLIDEKAVGIVSVVGDLIEHLYVLPDQHRKGYGSELLKREDLFEMEMKKL